MNERRFSGDFDRLRKPERVERLEVERVVLECRSGMDSARVLDVGTGTGLFAEAFIRAGCAAVGIDANPEMAAEAARLVPKATFKVAAAESLPFPPDSFDLVFYGLVFHEVDDPAAVLSKALSVARRRIAILEWPYREEEHGPPLEHRIQPNELASRFRAATGRELRIVTLTNLVLYLFDKEAPA